MRDLTCHDFYTAVADFDQNSTRFSYIPSHWTTRQLIFLQKFALLLLPVIFLPVQANPDLFKPLFHTFLS